MKNKIYIYTEDVYGVNGLNEFNSVEYLMDHLNSDDFLESVEIESLTNDQSNELKELLSQYNSENFDFISLQEKLMSFLSQVEGCCLERLDIEDFDNLCTGKSKFSKMAISIFCDFNEHEDLNSISNELKEEYFEFFETATESWIG